MPMTQWVPPNDRLSKVEGLSGVLPVPDAVTKDLLRHAVSSHLGGAPDAPCIPKPPGTEGLLR